jgi:uroporphyrinogen decarboxylase
VEAAARGGGYILCDQHGELLYHVPDEVIAAIVEAARKGGKYQ